MKFDFIRQENKKLKAFIVDETHLYIRSGELGYFKIPLDSTSNEVSGCGQNFNVRLATFQNTNRSLEYYYKGDEIMITL